jgi:hypothetical protein
LHGWLRKIQHDRDGYYAALGVALMRFVAVGVPSEAVASSFARTINGRY